MRRPGTHLAPGKGSEFILSRAVGIRAMGQSCIFFVSACFYFQALDLTESGVGTFYFCLVGAATFPRAAPEVVDCLGSVFS